jgi:hypothetical protein
MEGTVMRVKVQPPESQPWTAEYTCRNCKAVLEVEESDAICFMQDDQRDGPYPALGIQCPICQTVESLNLHYDGQGLRMPYWLYAKLKAKLVKGERCR